ncbi:hypothetical protein [Photobacterium leiognathi]|uniref:hypothetical protein n=1 Tax=Photobacterium leiognathi TaxID=553611 RepID=UPI0027398DD8|nr:hypothetical protein [Photobacterium leiognathi]
MSLLIDTVIASVVGKSGLIGQKVASSFSISSGLPAIISTEHFLSEFVFFPPFISNDLFFKK